MSSRYGARSGPRSKGTPTGRRNAQLAIEQQGGHTEADTHTTQKAMFRPVARYVVAGGSFPSFAVYAPGCGGVGTPKTPPRLSHSPYLNVRGIWRAIPSTVKTGVSTDCSG